MHWDQHERVLAMRVEEQPCSGQDLGALELLPSSAVEQKGKGKTIGLLYHRRVVLGVFLAVPVGQLVPTSQGIPAALPLRALAASTGEPCRGY